MKKFLTYAAIAMMAVSVASCDKGDDDNVTNPAASEVSATKAKSGNTKALLLCSFGSTFEESIKTFDGTIEAFEAKFPEYDIYMSFTSRTCVNRVEAVLDTPRYQPDLWLNAIGEAGYEDVIVQSLHVIPGEEYLSLMNTDVKKIFMITNFPEINVLRGDCLLENMSKSGSLDAVADVLIDKYEAQFNDSKQLVLLMGHGNPDVNYAANNKYLQMEDTLKSKLENDNVIVATVDYGPTVFWPWEGGLTFKDDAEDAKFELDGDSPVAADVNDYNTCVYAEVLRYYRAGKAAGTFAKESDLKITLVPFMTVAGDHAHNDLWGYGEDLSEVNNNPDGDASWRAMLEKMGFTINTLESHPEGATADKCEIKGLCDHKEILDIWINRLAELEKDSESWENGKGYQLEE